MKTKLSFVVLGSFLAVSAQAAHLECLAPTAVPEMREFRVMDFDQIYDFGSGRGVGGAWLEDRDARQFDSVDFVGGMTHVPMANECDNMYTVVFKTAEARAAIAGTGAKVTGRIEYAFPTSQETGPDTIEGFAPMTCAISERQ